MLFKKLPQRFAMEVILCYKSIDVFTYHNSFSWSSIYELDIISKCFSWSCKILIQPGIEQSFILDGIWRCCEHGNKTNVKWIRILESGKPYLKRSCSNGSEPLTMLVVLIELPCYNKNISTTVEDSWGTGLVFYNGFLNNKKDNATCLIWLANIVWGACPTNMFCVWGGPTASSSAACCIFLYLAIYILQMAIRIYIISIN